LLLRQRCGQSRQTLKSRILARLQKIHGGINRNAEVSGVVSPLQGKDGAHCRERPLGNDYATFERRLSQLGHSVTVVGWTL
jgi:hypothetical protein